MPPAAPASGAESDEGLLHGGGQKSVFECFLTEGERQQLLREIKGVLDVREDRFLLVPVDARREVRVYGVAVPPADPDYYYVG